MRFELTWEHVEVHAKPQFFEQSREAAIAAIYDYKSRLQPSQRWAPAAGDEFIKRCEGVIDGKPLQPLYFGMNPQSWVGEFPGVHIDWLVFTGFAREVYIGKPQDTFMNAISRAMADEALASKPGL